MKSVAKNVLNMKVLRRRMKLTQKETALILGYRSYFHYCLMERGRRRIAARAFAFYANPLKYIQQYKDRLSPAQYAGIVDRIKGVSNEKE